MRQFRSSFTLASSALTPENGRSAMDVNTLSLATMVAATIYAGVMILSVRLL
jgi:hypothetical protein